MNQKEAVIEALKKLGGRAHLSDIYKFAYPLADWSGSQNWQNTLRWYLHKMLIRFARPSVDGGNWCLTKKNLQLSKKRMKN